MKRRRSVLILCAVGQAGYAYTNIEDFQVGGFSRTLTGTQSFGLEQTGLDRNHSALGTRGWFLAIGSNFDNVPLHLDVGEHEQKLATTSDRLLYRMDLALGAAANSEIDLSKETSIYFDLYTDPPNIFADQWRLLVTDVNGRSAGNDGWVLRQGGIQFRISSFSGQIDWSRVRSMQFTENMDEGFTPPIYSVTHIYAVPEPITLLLFPLSLLALKRLRGR